MIAFLAPKMCRLARFCSDGQQSESTRCCRLPLSNTRTAIQTYRGIMELAGEPGDRWLLGREVQRREESPDTVVVGSQESVTKRATRLVTPGDGHAGSAARQSYALRRVAPGSTRRGAAKSRIVPQRIIPRQNAAQQHRARKPAGRLRNARSVWQG